jgi:hypothetical protein
VKGAVVARILAGSAASAAIAFGSAAAHADERCADVESAGGLEPVWASALADLRRQLTEMPAADCRGVALTVERVPEGVRVVATARDGGRAERIVQRPASLVATGLGLVMTIPRDESAARPPPPAPPPAPSPPSPSLAVQPAPPPPAPAAPAHTVGVELGVEAGGRVAVPGAITMIDVEVHAGVILDQWLLFLSIRDAPLGLFAQQGVDADAYVEAAAGLGVGRRFDVGLATFDVALVPSLVATRMEYDYPPGSESNGFQGNDVELRLGALVRMGLPLSRTWRLTLTVDTDLAPGNLANPARISLPSTITAPPGEPTPFPAWTTGIRLGATGALL